MRELFVSFIETKLGASFLLITCGLPATAKTGVAEEISHLKHCPLLQTDLIRLKILKDEDVWDRKAASDMDKRTLVYDEMLRQAEEILKNGDSVILDGTFLTQSLRKRAASLAAKYNMTFIILQTDCPPEVSFRRIARRTREKYESNALTQQAYLNNKRSFEEVDVNNLKTSYPDLAIVHLIVDTRYDYAGEWYITGVERK